MTTSALSFSKGTSLPLLSWTTEIPRPWPHLWQNPLLRSQRCSFSNDSRPMEGGFHLKKFNQRVIVITDREVFQDCPEYWTAQSCLLSVSSWQQAQEWAWSFELVRKQGDSKKHKSTEEYQEIPGNLPGQEIQAWGIIYDWAVLLQLQVCVCHHGMLFHKSMFPSIWKALHFTEEGWYHS